MGNENPNQISAFATHSTGLKYKGDGNRLPENWGECDGCQWWPFAPIKYSDPLGLKACVFDNTGDGGFYTTSKFLAKEWPQLGNPSESHFASGGHCQNIPYSAIVKCLGISGSSPSPPSPPSPSPSPDEPPVACQACFIKGCPNLHKTSSTACANCVRTHQGSCASSCVPYPFQKAKSWFCDASTFTIV